MFTLDVPAAFSLYKVHTSIRRTAGVGLEDVRFGENWLITLTPGGNEVITSDIVQTWVSKRIITAKFNQLEQKNNIDDTT